MLRRLGSFSVLMMYSTGFMDSGLSCCRMFDMLRLTSCAIDMSSSILVVRNRHRGEQYSARTSRHSFWSSLAVLLTDMHRRCFPRISFYCATKRAKGQTRLPVRCLGKLAVLASLAEWPSIETSQQSCQACSSDRSCFTPIEPIERYDCRAIELTG